MRARLAGQVHDAFGQNRRHDARSGGGVVEIGLEHRHAGARAPGDPALRQHDTVDLDVGPLAAQMGDEVASDEAAGPRDENPHRYPPRPDGPR